jgi:shikimate kinase
MNIIFTGFMATGKTVTAKLLAEKLNMKYIVIDSLIEEKENSAISDIFEKKGEAYFRNLETEIIKEVTAGDNLVIDTGGGAIIKQENFDLLTESGVIICLTASPEVIYNRVIKDNTRPLLEGKDKLEEIKRLLAKRDQFYKKADYMIDTSDKTFEGVLEDILLLFPKERE